MRSWAGTRPQMMLRGRIYNKGVIIMEPTVIVALVGLVGSVFVAIMSYRGTVKSGELTQSAVHKQLEINQAVTNERIAELTREVREHNEFARRMPVVEEQIKVANHRISDLEEALKHE